MKDKIKRLFQGTREDQIIACSLLVKNYDPWETLKEWQIEYSDNVKQYFETSGDKRGNPERPIVLFKYREDIFLNSYSRDFYYKYAAKRYILCCEDTISICYEN